MRSSNEKCVNYGRKKEEEEEKRIEFEGREKKKKKKLVVFTRAPFALFDYS